MSAVVQRHVTSHRARALRREELCRLAEFRYRLRKFLHFSQDAAEVAGLRPQQYQLLLAIRGLPSGVEPIIANVAGKLMLRHNSAVELIDRTIELGFLSRSNDPVDHRRILLKLTPEGENVMRSLAEHHLRELEETGPELIQTLNEVIQPERPAKPGHRKNTGRRSQ